MSALFRLFLDICLFRRGPQDTPYSIFLFLVLLLMSISLDFYQISLSVADATVPTMPERLLFIGLETLTFLVTVYMIMWLFHFPARTLQTITSLYGVDLVISFFQIPVVIIATQIQGVSITVYFLIYFLLLASLGWMLAVHAHILRHALSINLFKAGVIAVGLFILNIMIQKQLLTVQS